MPAAEHTFKPSIANAVLPLYLKNLFKAVLLVILYYLIGLVLGMIGIGIPIIAWYWGILIAILGALIPLTIEIVVLSCTTYQFYDSYVEKEFRFFSVNRYSVPYHQIVNVDVQISLWDRISSAGDMVIHTAEDAKKDLHLLYVPNTEEVQALLYTYISSSQPQRT